MNKEHSFISHTSDNIDVWDSATKGLHKLLDFILSSFTDLAELSHRSLLTSIANKVSAIFICCYGSDGLNPIDYSI